MGHPLSPDLTKLTTEELHSKRAELQNRFIFAYRMGNGDLVHQLQLIIDDYALEIENRNRKMLDDAAKNGKNFADKIDITK
jgi:hypothetical protein